MFTAQYTAGMLLILLGVAHTVIGEILIFQKIRVDGEKRAAAIALLPMRRWRSIWSTWHLATLLGAGTGAALMYPSQATLIACITSASVAIFWSAGTRGRHPAWALFVIIFGLLLKHHLAN